MKMVLIISAASFILSFVICFILHARARTQEQFHGAALSAVPFLLSGLVFWVCTIFTLGRIFWRGM